MNILHRAVMVGNQYLKYICEMIFQNLFFTFPKSLQLSRNKKQKINMKKIILPLALSAIFLSSCAKQETDKDSLGSTNVTAQKPKTQHYEKALHDCFDPSGNCGAGTVVKAPKKHEFELMNGAISQGSVGVHNFFNTQEGLSMAEYFGDDNIALLTAGTYTMLMDHNADGRVFYLVGDANTLNFDNAEFVLPVSFE